MTQIVSVFLALSIGFAAVGWLLPEKQFRLFASAYGALVVCVMAPISLLWLACITVLGWWVMRDAALRLQNGWITGLTLTSLVLAFLLFREFDWLTSLGAAYFTLRLIHVIVDTKLDLYQPPSLGDLVVYMFYPPVFLSGPIHRYPNFKRQLERRRVSAEALAIGAERVLLGLFMVIFCGGYLVREALEMLPHLPVASGSFLANWAKSAVGWVDLYFVFAGLSSVAVGCSLIVGIKIEENFNAPYRARSLLDFWGRWHISLTSWCRDYIYKPMTSYTRKPVLGVLLAMLVLGLWHETSFFYVGWSIWQALGILLSRGLQPFYRKLPNYLDAALSPLLILGWLSLANPVVKSLEGFF